MQGIIRYRKLFADVIPADTLDQIRECTNKSWVLGSSKFKAQIESELIVGLNHLGEVVIENQSVSRIKESDPLILDGTLSLCTQR